jgi:hypothetical protein
MIEMYQLVQDVYHQEISQGVAESLLVKQIEKY